MVANKLVRRTSASQSEGSQRGENVADCEEDRLAATDCDRERAAWWAEEPTLGECRPACVGLSVAHLVPVRRGLPQWQQPRCLTQKLPLSSSATSVLLIVGTFDIQCPQSRCQGDFWWLSRWAATRCSLLTGTWGQTTTRRCSWSPMLSTLPPQTTLARWADSCWWSCWGQGAELLRARVTKLQIRLFDNESIWQPTVNPLPGWSISLDWLGVSPC